MRKVERTLRTVVKGANTTERGNRSSLSRHRQLSHVQPTGRRAENTDLGPQRQRKDKEERETLCKDRKKRS